MSYFAFMDEPEPIVETPAEPTQEERWLPIEGWPGYEVSDWGRVRTFWGPGGKGCGKGRRSIGVKSKLIGGHRFTSGHIGVLLYRNNSTESRRAQIHVLVMEAFVGVRPDGMFACNNDGDPSNNRLSNLRWDTPRSNLVDTLKHGKNLSAVLNETDIEPIWARLLKGETSASIARNYGVNSVTILAIKSRKSWTYITESFPSLPDEEQRIAASADQPPVYIPACFTNNDQEIWLPIPGYPAYRVSTLGNVESFWCRAPKGNGKGAVIIGDVGRKLSPTPDQDGYLGFTASNGIQRGRLALHKCVLLTFAGIPPIGMVACHSNGIKTDNRASNLRWDTSRSNARDRVQHAKAKSCAWVG